MASNIDSTSIDAEYPVAGRDNDSQGFRDNFSTIKNSLAAAKAEIEDLQNKAVLKAALTEDTLENNMAGSLIIDVDLQQASFKGYITSADADTTVDFINGHYQKVTVSNNLSLTLTGWPTTERYAEMRVEIVPDGTGQKNITFVNAIGNLKTDGNSNWTGTQIATDNAAENPASTILEFFTNDGGATVFARYLGQFA